MMKQKTGRGLVILLLALALGFCQLPALPVFAAVDNTGTFESLLNWKETANGMEMNCTPFVSQYDILKNKWGDFLCQEEYQTSDTHRNSNNW